MPRPVPIVEEIPTTPPEEQVFDPIHLRKRGCALQELVQTEESFVKHMGYLLEKFRPGFLSILSAQDDHLFFDNIQPIIESSKVLIVQFKEELAKGPEKAEIGHIFLTTKIVQPFIAFNNLYLTATTRWTELLVDKAFQKAAKAVERSVALIFTNEYIVPVQRMPRYILLLKETRKFTPQWHPDYEALSDAMDVMAAEAQRADAECSEANRRLQLCQLERSIRECPPLVVGSRNLVGSFPMALERQELVLLTDLVMIVKEKRETLSRKKYKVIKQTIDLLTIIEVLYMKGGIKLRTQTGQFYQIPITAKVEAAKVAIDEQLAIHLLSHASNVNN